MKSRSRGGCAACLQNHKKCDEARPSCSRCQRLAIGCDYTPHIRWFHGPQLPRKRRRGRSGTTCQTSVATTSREAPGPSTERAAAGPISASPHEHQNHDLPPCIYGGSLPAEWPTEMDVINLLDTNTKVVQDGSSESTKACRVDDPGELSGDAWTPPGLDDPRRHFAPSFQEHFASDQRAQLSASPSPENSDGIDQDEADGIGTDSDEIDGSIIQSHTNNTTSNVDIEALAVDRLASSGPIRGDIGSIFFDTEDQYHAFRYFVQSVALIIPAWSGSRNGYKQVATLALSSPVLLDTLVSVSTIYMHMRGMVPQSAALRRQSRALASLRRSINVLSTSSEAMAQDTACLRRDLLATILLQITVEIANGTSVIPTHLSYALQLFQGLGYDKFRPTSSVGVVLVQRMTNIDVIGSIFWQRRPLLPLDFWYFTQEEYQVDETTPTFQETTGCPLWVISALAAISHLVADIQDGLVDEGSVLGRAMELESSLTGYGNSKFSIDASNMDPSAHLDAVCECYYWTALIILQRRVFRDAKDSRRVQYCLARSIDLLRSLPLGCGPDSQLSLPLYVAAQVSITPKHRAFLRLRSSKLSDIYPLKTRIALTAAFDNMWAASDAEAATHVGEAVAAAPDLMKDMALFIC